MADADMNDLYFLRVNVTEDDTIYDDLEFQFHHPIPRMIYVVMLLISTLAIIAGNAIYLLAIYRNQKLRSTVNMLIINLAVSDIQYFICLSARAIAEEMQYWFWGSSFCKAFAVIPELRTFVFSVTLLFIAIERYLVIVRRSDKPWSPIAVEIVSLAIWTTGILATLHWAMTTDIIFENYASEDKAYSSYCATTILHMIFQFFFVSFEILHLLIPISTELYVYIAIWCAMSKYASQVGPSTLISAKRTVCCAVFISALNILHCLQIVFGQNLYSFLLIFEVLLSLTLPVFYGYMDTGIRQAYFSDLRCFKLNSHQTEELENIVVPDYSSDRNDTTEG